jgi:hypothetical protein
VTLPSNPFFITHDGTPKVSPEIIFGSDEKPTEEVAFEADPAEDSPFCPNAAHREMKTMQTLFRRTKILREKGSGSKSK